MSIQKLLDTRKLAAPDYISVAPNGLPFGTTEPYINKGASGVWKVYDGSGNYDQVNVTEGEIKLFSNAYGKAIIAYTNDTPFLRFAQTLNCKVGFIVTVELTYDAFCKVFVTDEAVGEVITQSGRYTGVITSSLGTTGSGIGVWLRGTTGKAPGGNAPAGCNIKEIFFFNADLYTYEDFLVDPVSKLVATANPGNDGPALGNLVPSSEDFFSVDRKVAAYGNWNPLSRTANAGTAPNGNGNATRLTATGASQATYSKEFPVKPGKTYTYSAYVKGVSGTGQWTLVAIPGTAARVYITEFHSASIIPNSSTEWVRLSITAQMPPDAALCQFVIQSGSGSGDQIFAWGEQVVEAPERGAYTQTNGVEILASPLIGLQNGIRPPTGIAGIIGFATMIPDYGDYKVGSRLENIAWDGKFSTPIAWVCTASGNPGTWKAVYVFDALNAEADPFFNFGPNSLVWGNVDPSGGTGTLTIKDGVLTVVKGTSSVIQLYGQNGNCPAAVPYEILTHEWNIAVGSIVVRICDDGTTDTRRSAGVGSADYTVPGTLANATRKNITLLFDAANVTATKMLVRPKYPFLNQAPAVFAALPTVAAYPKLDAVKDTWYINASVAFAAGVITMGATTLLHQKLAVNMQGTPKTYRARANFSAVTGGAVPILYIFDISGNAIAAATFPASNGLKEITFTCNNNLAAYAVLSNSAGVGSYGVDYIRIYTE